MARGSSLVTDARGRRVTRLDPITLQALHRTEVLDRTALSALLNDLEHGLAGQLRWRAWLLRILLGLAVMTVVFGLLAAVGDTNFRHALWRVATHNVVIYLPLIVGTFFIPYLIARKRHDDQVFRRLVQHQICPHCGYDLTGLVPDDTDGATVCPECGCAWIMPP
jgi:hypothetical protein